MINKDQVKHIAKLARLGILDQEQEKFQKDLFGILEYFNSLKKADISKIEPTLHPAENFLKKKLGAIREDESNSQSPELVSNLVNMAPDKKGNHIKVKTIL